MPAFARWNRPILIYGSRQLASARSDCPIRPCGIRQDARRDSTCVPLVPSHTSRDSIVCAPCPGKCSVSACSRWLPDSHSGSLNRDSCERTMRLKRAALDLERCACYTLSGRMACTVLRVWERDVALRSQGFAFTRVFASSGLLGL